MSSRESSASRVATWMTCLALALALTAPSAAHSRLPPPEPAPRLYSPAELELDLQDLLFHPAAIFAVIAFERGEPGRALHLTREALRGPLDTEERAALLYLEALCLNAAGRAEEAFLRFGELAFGGAPPGLDVQAAWHHARLGLRTGGEARAEGAPSVWEALEKVPLESRHGPDARLHLSRKSLAEGDLETACRLASEVAKWREGTVTEAPARLSEARCSEAAARARRGVVPPAEVRRLLADVAWRYHSIAVQWPDLPTGESARQAADRLQGAGIPRAPVDIEEHLARARRIVERRGPRTSTAALHRIRRILPEPGASRIDLLLASVAAERRHLRSARRLYSNVLRRSTLPREVRAEAAFALEELRSRRAPTASVDRLLTLADDWRGTRAASEALARAGEIAWRVDRQVQAAGAFQRCLGSHPEPQVSGRCRFGLAWLRWQEGRPAQAHELLAPLGSPEPYSLYWYGRFLEESDQREAAKERFLDLAQGRPLSYYSLLAKERLGPDLPARASASSPPDTGSSNPDILAASTLTRMGLFSEARVLLTGLERSTLGREDRKLASLILHSLGETPSAIRMAPLEWDQGLLALPGDGAAVDAVLAYPRAFSHVVESEHRHPAVPATLLYALIRAESAFDPDARSGAWALGLTQVVRQTAAQTAESLGIEAFRFGMLTDPEMSVRVGSAHLALLLERYEGNVPLAIAAYNAGETAVDRWLARRGHLSAEAFIHEIPFRETNRYTRRVLSFWAIYRSLYEGEEGLPSDLRFDRPFSLRSRPLVAEAHIETR